MTSLRECSTPRSCQETSVRPRRARKLELVKKADPDNPFTQYNVELIYLDMKNYDKALEQAHKAYELGFGRTELRDRLKSAGRWKDPEPGALMTNPGSNPSEAPGNPASAAN